jgi:hypothetical protein
LMAILFHTSLNTTTVWLQIAKLSGAVSGGGLASYEIQILVTWIVVIVIVAFAGPRYLSRAQKKPP